MTEQSPVAVDTDDMLGPRGTPPAKRGVYEDRPPLKYIPNSRIPLFIRNPRSPFHKDPPIRYPGFLSLAMLAASPPWKDGSALNPKP